jgi:hypothetical protein
MRIRHFAILVTLILVESVTTARAETMVSHFKIKGESVVANFQASSPDDSCVGFFVTVVASDLVERMSPPKSKVAQPHVMLFAGSVDNCLGITLFSSFGEALLTPQMFQIAHDLQSAMLKTPVVVFDVVSFEFFDLDIDLTWTAAGPADRQNTKETVRDRDLGIFIKTHLKGVTAPAETVGTVVTTMMGVRVNFTPEPSNDAEIMRVNNSSLTIEKTM